ncbi:MAG: glutamate-1-semialdehyde 2,1-aminomutase [Spirochaetes bacterium]|nr:glutamate-1-semialdehyde 2,1-aminomutase [Spirochaetota bacterium]
MKQKISQQLWRRAQETFPGGVNSPVRAFRSVGGNPLFIASGKGSYTKDADGNRHLDFLSSWGPLILGHAPTKVVKATEKALRDGSTFGTTTERELALGEFILSHLPFLGKIRFVNSGTEAVMTALRLARGVTGREKIIKFEGCYHGHSDALLARAGSGLLTLSGNIADSSSPGVPESIVQNTLVLPLDDAATFDEAIKKYGDSIAAVIIEPVPANAGLLLQRRAFIDYIVAAARANKSLVIFDEVISGFRLTLGGYAGRENLNPDLITYGKIIGGGLPVGAIAGEASLMNRLSPEGPVYQAGTLSGNPLAMAAGLATLKILAARKGEAYVRLKNIAAYLKKSFAAEVAPLFTARDWQIELVQEESLFWFSFQKSGEPTVVRSVTAIEAFSAAIYARIFHELLERGVYMAPSAYEVGFLNTTLRRRDIDFFIQALRKTIKNLPTRIREFS